MKGNEVPALMKTPVDDTDSAEVGKPCRTYIKAKWDHFLILFFFINRPEIAQRQDIYSSCLTQRPNLCGITSVKSQSDKKTIKSERTNKKITRERQNEHCNPRRASGWNFNLSLSQRLITLSRKVPLTANGKHLDCLACVLQHFSARTYSACPPTARVSLQEHSRNVLWACDGWKATSVRMDSAIRAPVKTYSRLKSFF